MKNYDILGFDHLIDSFKEITSVMTLIFLLVEIRDSLLRLVKRNTRMYAYESILVGVYIC